MDVHRAIAARTKKGFAVRYFETAKEAADYLAESISGKTVGIGGSMTIEQMGLYDRLTKNNTVFWHWKTDDLATRVSAASTQVYLTSANAIAETGEIINIDGSGNPRRRHALHTTSGWCSSQGSISSRRMPRARCFARGTLPLRSTRGG